jgi:hypothetical protein
MYFLIITAWGEAGTGLLALVSPSLLLALLLGVDQSSPEAIFCGRIAGAALLALGSACWCGRSDRGNGLLISVLLYDVAAALILAFTGLFLGLVGIGLWPAVALHAVLALWCVGCLWNVPRGKGCANENELKEVPATRAG